MTPEKQIKHGDEFPFDATDEWREDFTKSTWNPKPKDWAHATARGIIAELRDRNTIKHGFDNIDENTRAEIVQTLAAIIRSGETLRYILN